MNIKQRITDFSIRQYKLITFVLVTMTVAELVLILSESSNFLNIITFDKSLKNGEFNE